MWARVTRPDCRRLGGSKTRAAAAAWRSLKAVAGHPQHDWWDDALSFLDVTSVRASGTACAGTADDLDRVELTATRSGSAILIEAHTADTGGRLDLLLEVPDTLPLEIDDTSGSVEIADVAAVDLRDSSGGIDIAGVAGDVRVRDGSGGIDISGVGGSVIIEDDGSGSIDITAVGRDVIVEDDGSGSIDVADVGGDFIVRDGGSGGVRHNGVAGRVDIGSD